MNKHKIRSLSVFTVLVLLVGFIFGFTQGTDQESPPVKMITVDIGAGCTLSSNPINVSQSDLLVFTGSAADVEFPKGLTTPQAQQTPATFGINANAPTGTHQYSVTCSGASPDMPDVAGHAGGGTPPEVMVEEFD